MMMMEVCRASGGKHGHTSVFCRSEAFFSTLPSFPHSHSQAQGASPDPYLRPCCFFCTLLRAGREKNFAERGCYQPVHLILRWFTGKPDATCPRRKEETKRRRQPCSPRTKPWRRWCAERRAGRLGRGGQGRAKRGRYASQMLFAGQRVAMNSPVLIPPHIHFIFSELCPRVIRQSPRGRHTEGNAISL